MVPYSRLLPLEHRLCGLIQAGDDMATVISISKANNLRLDVPIEKMETHRDGTKIAHFNLDGKLQKVTWDTPDAVPAA